MTTLGGTRQKRTESLVIRLLKKVRRARANRDEPAVLAIAAPVPVQRLQAATVVPSPTFTTAALGKLLGDESDPWPRIASDQFAAAFATWWRMHFPLVVWRDADVARAICDYCAFSEQRPQDPDEALKALFSFGVERTAKGLRIAPERLAAAIDDNKVRAGIVRVLQGVPEMTVSAIATELGVHKATISKARHGVIGIVERRSGRELFLSLSGVGRNAA